MEDLRFILAGEPVHGTETLADLELEDGDVIHCFLPQVAC